MRVGRSEPLVRVYGGTKSEYITVNGPANPVMTKKAKKGKAKAEAKAIVKEEKALVKATKPKTQPYRGRKAMAAIHKASLASATKRGLNSGLLKKYGHPKIRSGKISRSAELAVYGNDPKAYGESLAFPELHVPARPGDGSLFPTVVAHIEFEVNVPVVQDGKSAGDAYAGIAINPRLKSCYQTVSAAGTVAAGDLTWGAASDIPALSTFTSNFNTHRIISAAVHVIDINPAQYRAGEFGVLRIMQNSQFSASGYLPNAWSSLTNIPQSSVIPNEIDLHGARATYFPNAAYGNAEEQFIALTDTTSVNGSIMMIAHKGYYANPANLRARVFLNVELVPYEESFQIVDPSVDVGKPAQMGQGVLTAARILSAVGNSVNGLEAMLGNGELGWAWSSAKAGARFISSLLGFGTGGVGRTHSMVVAARQSLTPEFLATTEGAALDAQLREIEVAFERLIPSNRAHRITTDEPPSPAGSEFRLVKACPPPRAPQSRSGSVGAGPRA